MTEEIAAGQSYYQMVQQPIFTGRSSIFNGRRGDLMLLINGMPVFYIELKHSGIPVSQACNQMKSMHMRIFFRFIFLATGVVAMNPDETVYFANRVGRKV